MPEQDSGWNCCSVATFELGEAEKGDYKTKAENTTPNFRVTPWVDGTTPLESKEQAYNGADEERSSKQVDLSYLLSRCHAAVLAFRVVKEEEDGGNGDPAEGEVDPKASAVSLVTQGSGEKVDLPPTPCELIRKSAPKERPYDGRYAKHTR